MKTLRRIAVVVVALAIVGAGIWFATRPKPVEVVVATVARGVVEATVANTRAGTVNARRRAKLAPGQGGQVAELLVHEGDRVQTGQVMIRLWNADLEAQLALAKGQVERSRAQADEARLRAELAERDAARERELLAQQISNDEKVDRADSEAKAARATERAAVAAVTAQQLQIGVVEAELERTIVKAPFPGIVAEVNGEIGEFVTPSPVGIPTPPAVDLIDDGAPYVTAPIDEVDAAQVRVGMAARITLDAFGKREFTGKVRRIAPYVLDREKQARTVDVEVDFAAVPDDVTLLAGYSADVEVLLQRHDDVVRVPTEALRDGRLFVRGADGRIAEREVKAGIANWRFTEIDDGLAVGEQVVLSRDRKGVEAGAVVAVEGAEAKAAPKSP